MKNFTKKYIDNSDLFNIFDYIYNNIKYSTKELYAEVLNCINPEQGSMDIRNLRKICMELFENKLISKTPDFTTKTIYIRLLGPGVDKETLEMILNFFQTGASGFSYWDFSIFSKKRFLIQFDHQKKAEKAYSQLSDFKYHGNKILISSSPAYDEILSFEKRFFLYPKESVHFNSNIRVYKNLTKNGLYILIIKYYGYLFHEGHFITSSGERIKYSRGDNCKLLPKPENPDKTTKEDINQLLLMLQTYHNKSGSWDVKWKL